MISISIPGAGGVHFLEKGNWDFNYFVIKVSLIMTMASIKTNVCLPKGARDTWGFDHQHGWRVSESTTGHIRDDRCCCHTQHTQCKFQVIRLHHSRVFIITVLIYQFLVQCCTVDTVLQSWHSHILLPLPLQRKRKAALEQSNVLKKIKART